MKKIINKPENFVEEFMEGILAAYGDRVKTLDPEKKILVRSEKPAAGKVGIVTAGGSGHLPVFLGYVGAGMLDGCAVGEVFASPSAKKMEDMIRYVDQGNGVLCLYGNYGGDVMNFEMACENLDFDGIRTEQVLVKDDVASRPKEEADMRRGVAGMVYAFKVAGAAADEMLSLDEVAQTAREALENIRTMGFALTPCIVPMAGKATFSIGENDLELGMGLHGEPGIEVCEMKPADEIADIVLDKLLDDMPVASGEEVSVMINGLGATPLEELFILYRRVHERLKEKGISVYMPHVGEFATSMEMAGASITVFRLNDKMKKYLRKAADTPFYTNHNK